MKKKSSPKKAKIRIRGQNWRILIKPTLGKGNEAECEYASRTIRIHPRSQDKIACIIHEVVHACFPDLREHAVIETEAAICRGILAVVKLDSE